MDRREAVRRITNVLGATLAAPTLAGLLAGCEAVPEGTPYQPVTLSPELLERVRILSELIIPETETPGASAAQVHVFVDRMLTDFYSPEATAQFVTDLSDLDVMSGQMFGKDFDRTNDQERTELLAILDSEAFPDPDTQPNRAEAVRTRTEGGNPPFMRTLKELTVSGYYTSEVGQTVELRIAPLGSYQPDIPLGPTDSAWA